MTFRSLLVDTRDRVATITLDRPDAYNALDLAKVISAILVIGAVGLLIDLGFVRLGQAVAVKEARS